MNYKIHIEYEGTRYRGWQKQRDLRTVQGFLEEAISKVLKGEKFELIGSGRTDAGVHALEQIANLKISSAINTQKIQFWINDNLPSDIHILKIEKANDNFHARHNAVARSYIYQISKRRTAFVKNFVWWIKDELNVAQMEKAVSLFVGMHDFTSFCEEPEIKESTKVLVNHASVKEFEEIILIRVIASHFLHKMVRRMVGTIAAAGRGAITIEQIEDALNTKNNFPAEFTAPPSGLFLEKVYYDKTKIILGAGEPTVRIR